MKKFLSLIAALLLAALLTACGGAQMQGASIDASDTSPAVSPSASGDTGESVDEPDGTALTLPILDEISQSVTVGTAGSSLKAVPVAVKLLDWGVNTGLDPAEIQDAAAAWLAARSADEQAAFIEQLTLVDATYQALLGDGAEDLLSTAGCENTDYPWSDQPVESIEAIMNAAGLR